MLFVSSPSSRCLAARAGSSGLPDDDVQLRALERDLDVQAARDVLQDLLGATDSETIRQGLESLAAPEVLEFVKVRKGV